MYNYLADLVVVLHGFFVLFVLLGGFLVLWKTRMAWAHLPAVIWAACIEFFGWICPLTPLENMLRQKAGVAGYESGFVEHYVIPLLYPAALTRKLQIGLGLLVLGLNLVIYLIILSRRQKNLSEQEQ